MAKKKNQFVSLYGDPGEFGLDKDTPLTSLPYERFCNKSYIT